MIPDRTNYEIWIIDYLDGNLDPGQIDELMTFLDKNPDIKEEFYAITQYYIRPANSTFRNKKSLKRSTSEISESQFEYLCIAASEKDLSELQAAEVEEIISGNPQKRKTYELFRKLKLTAPKVEFNKKYKLRKPTAVQRILRLSATALSAAAAVAIIILLYNLLSEKNAGVNSGSASANIKDTITVFTNQVKIAANNIPEEKKTIEKSPVRIIPSLYKSEPEVMKSNYTIQTGPDSSIGKSVIRPVLLSKIDFKQSVSLAEKSFAGTLVAISLPVINISETDESRDINGFIARILREKILKTNDQEKGKLKAYEIADAGILGLNKLFGWNMSLHKNKNEKGEIKSFYFSSKLLKFNVPVKKTEPLS